MRSSSSRHLENLRFPDDLVQLPLAGERDEDAQCPKADRKSTRAAQVPHCIHDARPVPDGERGAPTRAWLGARVSDSRDADILGFLGIGVPSLGRRMDLLKAEVVVWR